MSKTPAQKTNLSTPPSILAHQLKHPLSIMRNYIDVLLDEDFGPLNEKQEEYLRDVLTNIDIITLVVTDIMDLSRIEEDRYELNIEPTDIEALTRTVIGMDTAWAKAWGGEITLVVESAIERVNTDPLKIRQVIENLLGNAIRYGLPGNGKVEIKLKKEGDFILFSCKDGGIGVQEEDQGKVFSKFYRSEKAANIYPQGSGLGLFINRTIIEKSGGKIWFENNKDGGVTFYFMLPIVL